MSGSHDGIPSPDPAPTLAQGNVAPSPDPAPTLAQGNGDPSPDPAPTLAQENGAPSPDPLPTRPHGNRDQWEKERLEELKNMKEYRARSTADKAQIFQILGFYIVFQGVVVNTACTSTKLECGTSFFLVVLSALVSIGTAFSVHYKFADYINNNNNLLNSEGLFATVKARIQTSEEDTYREICKILTLNAKQKIQKDERTRRKFVWVAMSFLAVFSGIIVLTCIIIRCT